MVHQSATKAVLRNLDHEHPDYHLWLVWESISLESLGEFTRQARAWLSDRSELRSWSLDNADWSAVYEHFRRRAVSEIDEENERVASEDKWARYDDCNTCGVGAGLQCVNKRSGQPAKNAHAGRRKVGAELPSEPAQEAPTPEPAATTPAKRPGRSQGQSHALSVTPMQLAEYDTFKATCSCGELNGSNWTSRDDAVKEHERHVAAMLVSA